MSGRTLPVRDRLLRASRRVSLAGLLTAALLATPLIAGQDWAGLVDVKTVYDWDPSTLVPDLPEKAVAGVEAPIWTETLNNLDKLEYMAFPRLPGIAELGWSQTSFHDWNTYKVRLGAQGSRWDALSVNFYRAPEIDWH